MIQQLLVHLNLSTSLRICSIMRFSSSFVGAVSLLCSQAVASSLRGRDLESFIAAERAIALQGVLNNIGPDGSQVEGAGNYIIASPSKEDPDCNESSLDT